MRRDIRFILGVWCIASALGTVVIGADADLPLIQAVRMRDASAVTALLRQRVDVDARQGDGTTALAWAVNRDEVGIADLLLKAGANANIPNDYGVTPLSLACRNRNAAMVDRLLRAKADPNIAQTTGETPLMTCARSGSLEAVRLLLVNRANPNAKNRRGQTALMWAAAQKRPEVARMLIEHRADVNAASRQLEGFTPAEYFTFGLAEKFDDEPVGEVHQEVHGSFGGFTALMFAARGGDLETARVLVNAGADMDHASSVYGNALTVASLNGHQGVAIFLLQRRMNPNVVDRWGYAPLHYALREGITAIGMARSPTLPMDRQWLRPNMPDLVPELLEHKANPNIRVTRGFPPYNYLPFGRIDNGQLPYLLTRGATPFLLAAASGDAGSMRALLAAGADPSAATEEGATAVMVAAGLGKLWPLTLEQEDRALEALRVAVEVGGDVNAAIKDGRTALMGAAHIGANRLVQFLVDRGANVNAQDMYGQTAVGAALGIRPPNRNAGDSRRLFRRSAGQTGVVMAPHRSTADLLVRLGAESPPAAASRRGSGDEPGNR